MAPRSVCGILGSIQFTLLLLWQCMLLLTCALIAVSLLHVRALAVLRRRRVFFVIGCIAFIFITADQGAVTVTFGNVQHLSERLSGCFGVFVVHIRLLLFLGF